MSTRLSSSCRHARLHLPVPAQGLRNRSLLNFPSRTLSFNKPSCQYILHNYLAAQTSSRLRPLLRARQAAPTHASQHLEPANLEKLACKAVSDHLYPSQHLGSALKLRPTRGKMEERWASSSLSHRLPGHREPSSASSEPGLHAFVESIASHSARSLTFAVVTKARKMSQPQDPPRAHTKTSHSRLQSTPSANTILASLAVFRAPSVP